MDLSKAFDTIKHDLLVAKLHAYGFSNDILKGNAQFIFLCKPLKLLVTVCLMKMLKSNVTKKVIVCFYN